MRLYRCLPYLHKIRTEARNPNLLLERQRPLVVGARIWLSVGSKIICKANPSSCARPTSTPVPFTTDARMSFNHALPILYPSDHGRRTAFKRELLDHPLSNLYDSRLVISVEMCEVRGERTWSVGS